MLISLNPILGKVWNDVIRRARVNLTRKCFRQHKYTKRPHIVHSLFLATYFDIFLAIESKISPKMSIFLMLLTTIWEWSKLTFFKPKNIKSSYFEFQKSYIPQRKLKTHEIRIHQEKIRITAKNLKNLNFFQFSWHARGPPKNSVFHFPKILKNIFQKWLYWDKSNGERNKANNFGDASPTSAGSTDKYMVQWSNWPIPAWNRVKKIEKQRVWTYQNSQLTLASFLRLWNRNLGWQFDLISCSDIFEDHRLISTHLFQSVHHLHPLLKRMLHKL